MSKFTLCETCGKTIADEAEVCPHCGAKNRKKGFFSCSGCLVGIVLFVVLAIAVGVSKKNGGDSEVLPPPSANMQKPTQPPQPRDGNPILKKSLAYLKTVKEISRIDIIDYDVYLSFAGNKLPSDYKIVANAAAVNGSRALVSADESITRCSVWVIPENSPANVDHALYTVTARKGKIQ